MKKVLLAAAAVAVMGGTAIAGPNAGGTLVATLADGVVFTFDEETYCGAGATDCGTAIGRYDNTDTAVINVLAAFPGTSRLAGVTFGVAYNDAEVFLAAWGACGDFELGTGGWPGSGEGTAVTFSAAQEASLVDVYWFAAYNYYGNANTFDLIPHPSQGANFADDSVPSELDAIAALGSFGFATDGNVPCPQGDAPGACCFMDGSCTVVPEADCQGDFQGPDTNCDPNPCPPPPTGACCDDEGNCTIRTRMECGDEGYQGDDTGCDPNPCDVVPTVETSWGAVKGIYR